MPWSWNKCLLPPRHQYPVSFEYCPKSPTSHRVQCYLFCSSVPLVPAPPPPPPPRVWVWAWSAGPAGRRPSPAPAPPPPPWPGGLSLAQDNMLPVLSLTMSYLALREILRRWSPSTLCSSLENWFCSYWGRPSRRTELRGSVGEHSTSLRPVEVWVLWVVLGVGWWNEVTFIFFIIFFIYF